MDITNVYQFNYIFDTLFILSPNVYMKTTNFNLYLENSTQKVWSKRSIIKIVTLYCKLSGSVRIFYKGVYNFAKSWILFLNQQPKTAQNIVKLDSNHSFNEPPETMNLIQCTSKCYFAETVISICKLRKARNKI